MKQIALTLGLLTLLVSCESINFDMNVEAPFTLKKNKHIKRSVTIPRGQHFVETKLRKKSVVLDIKGVKGKFYFKVPQGLKNLPKNGRITLSSAQSGQPVSTYMDIKTNIQREDLVETYQSCTVVKNIPCYGYPFPYGRRFSRHGHPYYWNYRGNECNRGYRTVVFNGSKYVEYTPVTTTTDINMTFDNVATADGQRVTSFNDYSYEGRCNIH
jgi:hypothetical protein